MLRVAAALAGALAAALAFAAPALADDVLNVVGGTATPSFFDVEDIVAEPAGYFAQERLAVTKQYSGSSSNCFQIVASGKGDITSSVEAIILGYSKGLRLQVFLNRDPRSTITRWPC